MPNTYTFETKIDLPLRISLGKGIIGKYAGGEKWFALNLNIYRNSHFQILNKAKINFKEAISTELDSFPNLTNKKLAIKYTLYTKSNRLVDISNICSIVDKFFCDCLTEKNIISDDNCSVISEIKYIFGGVDKNNPRIEVNIYSITLESK